MQIRSTRQTPYQKIKNSKLGRLVREHKVGTGATAVAASAVIAGGAVQSEAFSRVAQYGIVPAVGAGVATLGAAAVHDAVVNDVGRNNLKATAKIAAGTTATLGGVQMVGVAYNIPVLDEALTGVVFDHGQALVGTGLLAGSALAGKAAVKQFQKAAEGDEKAVPLALGTGAVVGSAAAGLAGAELVGRDLGIPGVDRAFTGTLEFLTQSSAAAVAGGGLLLGGAVVAGGQAVRNLTSPGSNDYATAALASGAAAGGLGGLEVLGHGLGIEATRGLLGENAGVVGGLSVSALGGAVTRHAAGRMRKHGLTPLNTLGLSAGLATTGGGAGLAAYALGASGAAETIAHGTSAVAGAALGLGTYAFGKKAVESARKGRFGSAVFHGSGAAATAAGGLYAVGSGLGIEALEQAGSKVVDATLKPLTEHVLAPSLEFLFENPAIGGIGLALAVGGFVYSQMRD